MQRIGDISYQKGGSCNNPGKLLGNTAKLRLKEIKAVTNLASAFAPHLTGFTFTIHVTIHLKP